MLHWVTATNRNLVCCTESLQQTKKLFVALSHSNKQNLYMLPKSCQKKLKYVLKCMKMSLIMQKKAQKSQKVPKEPKSVKKLSIVDTLGNFLATYTNFVCRSDSVRWTHFLFVAVIQCDKLNLCLSQWLSATNNIEEKNILFICGMWQRNWKKCQKQTSFQIWISPALSNCFGVPCNQLASLCGDFAKGQLACAVPKPGRMVSEV